MSGVYTLEGGVVNPFGLEVKPISYMGNFNFFLAG